MKYKALDAGIELQTKSGVRVSDGTRPRALATTSFEKRIELQAQQVMQPMTPGRTQRPVGVQDVVARGRGLTTTSIRNDFFDTVPRTASASKTSVSVVRPSTRPVGVQDNMVYAR